MTDPEPTLEYELTIHYVNGKHKTYLVDESIAKVAVDATLNNKSFYFNTGTGRTYSFNNRNITNVEVYYKGSGAVV